LRASRAAWPPRDDRVVVGCDGSPFVGLPDDRCQCSHFGYVKKGSITYKPASGDETFYAGDAYVVGPGHTPVLHPGTEPVEFSPTAELNQTMEVVTKNMENMA